MLPCKRTHALALTVRSSQPVILRLALRTISASHPSPLYLLLCTPLQPEIYGPATRNIDVKLTRVCTLRSTSDKPELPEIGGVQETEAAAFLRYYAIIYPDIEFYPLKINVL